MELERARIKYAGNHIKVQEDVFIPKLPPTWLAIYTAKEKDIDMYFIAKNLFESHIICDNTREFVEELAIKALDYYIRAANPELQ